MQGIANPAYLEGFPFPALLSVALYCSRGGIRGVSISLSSPCGAFLHAYGSCRFIFDKLSLYPSDYLQVDLPDTALDVYVERNIRFAVGVVDVRVAHPLKPLGIDLA